MENLPYPLLIVLAGLWLAGLLLGSRAIGLWLLRRFGLTEWGVVSRSALAVGVGLAVVSYLVFALGVAQAYAHGWTLSALWLAVTVLGVWPDRDRLRDRPRWVLSVWAWIGLGLLGLLALLNLIPALVPAWDWDGLAYHLALPKIYLQQGGFLFRPDITHNLFPQFTEMLYLLGAGLPFGITAKLVHWSFGLLAAAAIYGLGESQEKPELGLLAAGLFYAQYLVHVESGTAFVDLAAAAYVALALLALQRAVQVREERLLLFTLFLAGLNGAIKWQGLYLTAAFGLVLLPGVWSDRARTWARRAGLTAKLAAVGLLPSLPYAVRASGFSGNPFWPLGFKLFGGPNWDALIDARVSAYHMHHHFSIPDAAGWLRLPLDLLLHGEKFQHGGPELRWPLVAAALLGMAWLFLRRQFPTRPGDAREGKAWAALGFAALVYALLCLKWLYFTWRYLLPWFPLFAWMIARGLSALAGWSLPWGRWLAIGLGVLFLCFRPPVHHDSLSSLKVILGLTPPQTFLAEKYDAYPAFQYLNQHQAPHERVLLFGENRGFYLDGDYLWGDAMMQQVVDYRRLATIADLDARLRELGIRWVLFRSDWAPDYLPPEITAQMRQWLARSAQLRFEAAGVQVFAVDRH